MERNVSSRMNENRERVERIILTVYVCYTFVMTLVSFVRGWGSFVPAVILGGMVVSLSMFWTRYRDYRFRAFFTSFMAWVNFSIYVLNSDDFIGSLSTMVAMVVLLAIYCIPEIIYVGIGFYSLLFFYHMVILRDLHIALDEQGLQALLRVASVYAAQYITYCLVKTQLGSNEKLLANIASLQQAERSKDDFMANVSHEIRTPVNTVCGISELLMREQLPQSLRGDVYDIQMAGRNLLSAVSDILDFSELASGKMAIVPDTYNITSTLNDIINMAIAKNSEKNLELLVDCEPSIACGLVGDEPKIRRAVMNIVDNAFKFTNEGGVMITASTRREKYGVNLLISVKDTGIGMKEETLEKLFTSFNQVDTKRSRQEGGLGLGLAISQTIVKKMGGFLSVKSVFGSGTEVQLVIPQKVADDKPIIEVKNPQDIHALLYLNLEKYKFSLVREGYEACIRHMAGQFGVKYRHCSNFAEVRRRLEKKTYTHVFVSWEEYCEEQEYFEELAGQMQVILILDRQCEKNMTDSRLARIYKPFYVLSIAAFLNGDTIQNTGEYKMGERFTAPEASVLVVDDNLMNLKVVEGLLRPYKIRVFAACSGKEALQKIESRAFDFVFMDHMMPEMDGVETFHRIRQKDGVYFQNVPVVALTANAIGGAREMFLAEGFADYVAKPIELSALERVLRKYIPEDKIKKPGAEQETQEQAKPQQEVQSAQAKPQQEVQSAQADTEQASGSAALGELAGIDVELGVAYCGGELDDYLEIIRMYYMGSLEKRREARTFLEQKDWENYVIVAHSIKSTSLSIGAVTLSDLAKNLELAGKAGDYAYIAAHNEAMLAAFDDVLAQIAANSVIFPDGAGLDEGEE